MFDAAMFASLLSAVFTRLVPQEGRVGQKTKSDGENTPACHLPWAGPAQAPPGSTTFNDSEYPPERLAQMPGGYPRPTPTPEGPIQAPVETEDSELSSDDDEPSNPSPLPAPATASTQSSRTTAILNLLTNPPTPKKTRNPNGAVYILPALHNGRPVLKIGRTAQPQITTRTQPIQSQCRSTALSFPPNLNQSTIWQRPMTEYHDDLVERLVHAELHDARYLFECVCGTRHREWFDVPREVAERVVMRWARFCEGRPWEEGSAGREWKGELKGEWKVRVERWRRMGVLASSSSSSSSSKVEWEERVAVWDRFVDFGWRGWAWYDLCAWARGVVGFLAEAVLIVVLAAVLVLGEGCFAWVALRMLVGVSWWLVLSIGGFRCVTMENWLRR